MFEWLPELLGSAATGGALGVVGNVVKSVLHSRDQKIRNEQALEIAKINADAQVRVAQATQNAMAQASVDKAHYHAQAAESQNAALEKQVQLAATQAESDTGKGGDGFADSVRKLIRPFLTVYMVVFTTILTLQVSDLELYKYLVMQIVMLTAAGFLFWFGGRPKERK